MLLIAIFSRVYLLDDELRTVTRSQLAARCAAWAYHFSGQADNSHITDLLRPVFVGCAYVCARLGFLAYDVGSNPFLPPPEGKTDGDWLIDATPPDFNADCKTYLIKHLTPSHIQACVSILAASKISYFNSNHHTGQKGLSSFMLKNFRTLFPDIAAAGQDTAQGTENVLHTVCHWASTHYLFSAFGMKTHRQMVGLCVPAEDETFSLSEDYRLRVNANSAPAGISRWFIIAEISKSFCLNPVMMMNPNLGHCAQTMEWSDKLQKATEANLLLPEEEQAVDPRHFHHIGCQYLTGTPRKALTDSLNDTTGSVGAFMFYCYPHHSITDSPHISKMVGGVRQATYTNAPGYDAQYDSFCKAAKREAAVFSNEKVKRLMGIDPVSGISEDQITNFLTLAGKSKSVIEGKIKELKEALTGVVTLDEESESEDDEEPEAVPVTPKPPPRASTKRKAAASESADEPGTSKDKRKKSKSAKK